MTAVARIQMRVLVTLEVDEDDTALVVQDVQIDEQTDRPPTQAPEHMGLSDWAHDMLSERLVKGMRLH